MKKHQQLKHPKQLSQKSSKPRGKKLNKGKARICLVPEEAILGAAEVFTHSETKYGPFNYRKGLNWLDITDSLDRHMLKFKMGIDLDEESGLPHTWHILANAMMLEYMRVHYPELDNRYVKSKDKKATPRRKDSKVRKKR